MSSPIARKLLKTVEDIIIKHKIMCRESIYQNDSINEYLPEMLTEICEVVGYYDDLVDAEEEQKVLTDLPTCIYCMKEYCECSDFVGNPETGDN